MLRAMAVDDAEAHAQLATPRWGLKVALYTRLYCSSTSVFNPHSCLILLSSRLRLGSSLSALGWRTAELDLYTAFLLHEDSAPVTWYCAPPSHSRRMERTVRRLLRGRAAGCSNVLYHGQCLVHPSLLMRGGVRVSRTVQRPGELVLVFPHAYHMSFDHGLVACESALFATERWIEYGKRHHTCSCQARRTPSMASIVREFQPSLAKSWTRGEDFGPHPEDERDAADLDEKFRKKLEREREKVTEDLFTFVLHEDRKLQYDYKNDRLHTPFPLKEKEKKKFEAWKRSFRKEMDIYQHRQKSDLRFKMDIRTGKCSLAALEYLRKSLELDKVKEGRELVAMGLFRKVQREVRHVPEAFLREKKVEAEERRNVKKIEKTMTAQLYRHVMKDEITAIVDPDTKELLSAKDDVMKAFLQVMPMSDLIQSGVFKLERERKVKIIKHVVEKSEMKKGSDSIEVDVYHYNGTDKIEKVYIAPRSKEILGDLPFELEKKMEDGVTIEDCLKGGTLTIIASLMVRRQEQHKREYACSEDIYWHRSKEIEVRLDSRERRFVAAEEANEREMVSFMMMAWADWEGMMARGELLKIGEVLVPKSKELEEHEQVRTSSKCITDSSTGGEILVHHAHSSKKAGRQVFSIQGEVVDADWIDPANLERSLSALRVSGGDWKTVSSTPGNSNVMTTLTNLPLRFLSSLEYEVLCTGAEGKIRVRMDPSDPNLVMEEDREKLGVLSCLPADILVAKGFLANRKTVKSLDRESEEALLSLIGKNFELRCRGNILSAVSPTERVAYMVKLSSSFDDDDIRRVIEAETRCIREEEAEVIRTEVEVLDGIEDDGYDSNCSEDPGELNRREALAEIYSK